MSEKIKVWIARDGELSGDSGEFLYLHFKQPRYDGFYWKSEDYEEVCQYFYEEVKNGECYEAEIILGEKL